MLKRLAVLSILSASLPASSVYADATTRPAAASQAATTRPAVARTKFPTAAEMAAKIVAGNKAAATRKSADDAKLQVAYFDLTGGLTEKPAGFSLFGGSAPTLRDLLDRFGKARDDASIKAVLINLGAGTGLNLSQANEVRDALVAMRRAGKKTFVYADTYDTVGYTVASGATNICLLEGGEVFVPGIGFETMFYKNAFDKLGVAPNYVQIGEYKGAEEPFTRNKPSEELAGELNKLVDSYFKQITDGIALHRNLKTEDVKRTIDTAVLDAKQAKAAGWVTDLVDPDGLQQLIKDELGGEVRINHDYGKQEDERVDLSNPFAFFALLAKKPQVSKNQKIAIVYAEGTIVDGNGGGGLLGGQSIGSEEIRRAMRLADKDATVKAVVIRIDSPGGSALASEAMWQAVRRVEKTKPVIISVGSMAASGGYYLASSGDLIIADPTAIVGSIGVVGGKFNVSGLYEKLGISTQTFSRGQNADLFSSTVDFSDRQKRMVTTWMKNTYDQFTDRVMTTRTGKIKDIDQVARGRIFLAADAKDLGMVDQIGGIEAAVTAAAERAKLQTDAYEVTTLPPTETLADVLQKGGLGVSAANVLPKVDLSGVIAVLTPDLRASLAQQLDLMQILDKRPVALMSPYVLRVR